MRNSLRTLTRCPDCILATIGAGFAFAIVALFVSDLSSGYDEAITAAKKTTRTYADTLALHTAHELEGVDRALRVAEIVRGNVAIRRPASWPGEAGPGQTAQDALRQVQQTSSLIVSIGWTDAAGDLQAASYDHDRSLRNVAGMPHFTAQREGHGDALFVGPPFRPAQTGEWLTPVSRRLNKADGSFDGIVTAYLDQSYFSDIYRSLDVGRNGSVLLVHRAGVIVARHPELRGTVGRAIPNGPLLGEYLPKEDAGSFDSVSVVDGVARVAGYRAVPNVPLVVAVSLSRDEVLQAWYRRLYTYGPMTALVVLLILLGTMLLMRRARSLADKTHVLQATLENVAHGLVMIDKDLRIIVCNRRYADMYGLTVEQTTPGTSLESILAARIVSSIGPRDGRDYIRRRLEEAGRSEPFSVVNEMRDGRLIAVTHQPIEGGAAVAIHQDITDAKRAEARIAFMAHHDLLTGLANRNLFMEKVEEAGARLRQQGSPFSVLMLDLDQFKNVNDSLGHPAGDVLLKEMAKRLKSALGEADVLARLGGDEFAILQPVMANQRVDAAALANRIIELATEPFDLDGHKATVGTSIGIALAPADGIDPTDLLKKADLALYQTKAEGRNGYTFFDVEMVSKAEARHRLETELRDALTRNEFELHYQPVVDIHTRERRGYEALVRWRHPVKGMIPPDQFIGLAEDSGLIVRLGEWILQTACMDAATWPADIKLAVNLSAVQFRTVNLFDVILCALVESGLPPEQLEVEITESVLLENESETRQMLNQLKNLGITIVLDDFGIGYSSLGYLTSFPVDRIKIDRSFTQGILERSDCAAVVSSVVTLARGLDITTTAEGVETETQFELLRAAGVNFVQGFLFGRPCRASELDHAGGETGERTAVA